MIAKVLKSLGLMSIVLVLASCVSLPFSPVDQLGPELATAGSNESLYYSPAGPSAEANQEQLINGFLYAGNGPQDDYSVARKFLTLNYSSKWHPSYETLIQTGSVDILSNTGTKLRLKVHYDARVEADGTYISEPGESRILEFRLLQENGEWRISSAPNLTVLLMPNFKVLFKAVPVYFWDKSFSYLVPDIRWFPTRASLATKLTNALIAGPAKWLSPAVQNILPEGTKLNINSVTVDNGTASIDFNSSALKIPSWKRPYLRSQLLATLGSVSGINQISISVERTVQVIGVGASGMPENNSTLPVIMTRDGLSHVAGATQLEIVGTKELLAKETAKAFALSSDETLVVLLGATGIRAHNVGLLGNSSRLIDDRKGLLKPNIDSLNNIWTASRVKGSALRVTDVLGNQISLPNPFGPKGQIEGIAISFEGARLAILHKVSGGQRVDVFAVTRDKSRKVIALGTPEPVTGFGNSIQEIGWLDHASLIALVKSADGFQSSTTVMVGGPTTQGQRTSGGTAVVGVIGGTQYYLSTSGELYISASFGWTFVRSDVVALRMAGQ
jgi:hypothetical protein